MSDTEAKIRKVGDSMVRMLLDKNRQYGDSALNPIVVFSKGTTTNALCVRINDKLSRIANRGELRPDDIADLTGYLMLLMIDNGWTEYNGEEKL